MSTSFEHVDTPMADIAIAKAIAEDASDIVVPLLPLVAHEYHDKSVTEKIQTVRALANLSVPAVFPVVAVSTEVSQAHNLKREDVIYSKALKHDDVRSTRHKVALKTLEARVRYAEQTGDFSRLHPDAL